MAVQLGWFAEDFKLLSNFKRLIVSKVAKALRTARQFDPVGEEMYKIEEEEGPDKWMRIILPHGLSTGHQLIGDNVSETQLKSFYFVGFFGTKALYKPDSDQVLDEVLDLDAKLVEDLKQNPYIICYASMFRNYLTDAFNMVIFTSEEAIPLWRRSANHELATGSLSEKFYANVRIHMGRFTARETEDEYEVFRTTFLDYTVKDNPHRHLQLWRNGGKHPSSYILKVVL